MVNDRFEFAERVRGRLDRLGLSEEDAARASNLTPSYVRQLLAADVAPPRGRRLVRLADALATSVSYLVGLDPDTPVPDEYLADDQGELGLLAADEETLLHAYRRLDVPSRSALLQVALKMAPEQAVDERRPRQVGSKQRPVD